MIEGILWIPPQYLSGRACFKVWLLCIFMNKSSSLTVIPGVSKRKRILVVLFNLVLACVALMAAAVLYYINLRVSEINRIALDASLSEIANGERGERVINILLVGSDSSANLDPDDPIRNGRNGEQLGDVIIIAHVDERSGDVALLSLPRDLWLPIPGTGRSNRINKAFESGGPALLIDTIEQNFDIPINHYANVDFAGFQGLVEAVGSVDIYFETPARDWNVNASPAPRSQTGFEVLENGCQPLDGQQALAYVRSRYYQTQNEDGAWVTDPSSDLGRIRRQQDFLRSLMKRAIELGARNPFVLNELVTTGMQNVTIDSELTPQLLLDIANAYRGFNPDSLQTYSMPVFDSQVGNRLVLSPSSSEAEPILEIFRGKEFSSPDTIQISLVGQSSNPQLLQVQSVLSGKGYRSKFVSPTTSNASSGTLVIRHGPDGIAAANMVASALGGSYQFEEFNGIAGRDVQIAIVEAAEPTELNEAPNQLASVTGESVAPAQPSQDDFDLDPARVACG